VDVESSDERASRGHVRASVKLRRDRVNGASEVANSKVLSKTAKKYRLHVPTAFLSFRLTKQH
jgi:hypothetical protein